MIDLNELIQFKHRSSGHTYESDGKEIPPQRPGFIEMEYREGDWYLRDSYSGHFQAPGMTVIYYQNKPVWTCAYGGKVFEKYYPQTKEIFTFLKQALRRKDLKQPGDLPVRGPRNYKEGKYRYTFTSEGDMKCFYGRERIFLGKTLVFYQDIIGGSIIDKNGGQ